MKKYISPFICGFGAGVLNVVPVVKSFGCCIIMPIAVYISLLLDIKASGNNKTIAIKKGIMFGLITGLYAALFSTSFEIIITFITKQNDLVNGFSEFQKMSDSLPFAQEIKNEVINLMASVREDIINYGFSFLYSISLLINNLVVNTIFGIGGGLISVQIINNRLNRSREN
ncbi:MAG: hypothetical protein KF816_06160 [Melioribacteraceae bacterium]|nr:hypothetical protein [Melioribacteraceae bacterium]